MKRFKKLQVAAHSRRDSALRLDWARWIPFRNWGDLEVESSGKNYAKAHPNSAVLVIKVAVPSIDLEREKAAVYAEAGAGEYGLVLVEQKQVEVHRSPAGKGYSCQDILRVGGVV